MTEQGGKTWRIGEVAQVVGLSRQTLHHYVALGLIRPVAHTPGGHRLFGGSVFRRLDAIHAAKQTRTLKALSQEMGTTGAGRPPRRRGR